MCGLWFGNQKPNFDLFFKDMVDEIQLLSTNGFNWKMNNTVMNSTADLIAVCVDNVARASVQGFLQFNAYFGCSWCHQPGETIDHTHV